MDTSLIRETYLSSAVIKKGDYDYVINCMSDGNPALSKELLDQITDCFIEICDLDCDVILAPEAMALPYGTALTLRTGIPMQIIRKRATGLPGEIVFTSRTGYSKSDMFLNFIPEGSRVMIVDDIISTGGTLIAMGATLKEHGIEVTEAAMVLNKSRDFESLSKRIPFPVRYILRVAVENGKPVLIE